MARDRKRAKQRQRGAAQRQPQPARGGREAREPEAKIDPAPTIPDLERGSADADIAKASIAAGSVDADEVSEELDAEVSEHPRTGEIYSDEIVDAGYEPREAGDAAQGAEGVTAARPATAHSRREAGRRERERGGS